MTRTSTRLYDAQAYLEKTLDNIEESEAHWAAAEVRELLADALNLLAGKAIAVTRTNATKVSTRAEYAATAKAALDAWAENCGPYSAWQRAVADLREYDAMLTSPYEITSPKHPEFVEALEERTEIEQ